MKSSKLCIITRLPLASLLFKGLATKHTIVKWSIYNWPIKLLTFNYNDILRFFWSSQKNKMMTGLELNITEKRMYKMVDLTQQCNLSVMHRTWVTSRAFLQSFPWYSKFAVFNSSISFQWYYYKLNTHFSN